MTKKTFHGKKPWEKEGISKSGYYRRLRIAKENGPASQKPTNPADEPKAAFVPLHLRRKQASQTANPAQAPVRPPLAFVETDAAFKETVARAVARAVKRELLIYMSHAIVDSKRAGMGTVQFIISDTAAGMLSEVLARDINDGQ